MQETRRRSGHPGLWFVVLAFLLVSTVGCASWFGDGPGGGPIDPGQTWDLAGLVAMPTTVDIGVNSAITATVTNPDAVALTYVWAGGGGTIVGTGTAVTWSHTVVGTYTISCTAADGVGNTDVANVTISVTDGTGPPPPPPPGNQAPAFVDDDGNPITMSGDVSHPVATQRIRFRATATDADGDPITYTWAADGAGTFSDETVDAETGQAQVFWAADAAGTYVMTVTADDGVAASSGVSATGSLATVAFDVAAMPSGFDVVGYEACGNCHADTVTAWMTTNHSDAMQRSLGADTPGAYGYRNDHCYECHAVGLAPVGGNGFIDLELTPEFANIQCEACHGGGNPAGMGGGHKPSPFDPGLGYEKVDGEYVVVDGVYQYDETYDGSGGYGCGLCHEGSRHGAFESWMGSVHATFEPFEEDGVTPEHKATGSSCAKCHNGAEFVRVMIDGGEGVTIADEDYDPSSVMIGCATCHDPHDAQFEGQLRVDSTVDVGIPFSDTDDVPTMVSGGRGNTCITCHNGRRDRGDYISRVTNGSRYFGPHGNPQGPVVFGLMGADLDGPVAYGTDHAHATMTENSCVSCHMYSRDYISSDEPHLWGHEMEPQLETCTACHTSATDLHALIDPLQAEIQVLMDDIVAMWPAAWKTQDPETLEWELENRDTDPPTGAGPPRNDPVGNAYREVLWNYVLVGNDLSMGVHNPTFVRSLLTEAITRLGELEPPIVTAPQAGYVGKDTCMGCHSSVIDIALFDNHRHNHKLNPATSEFIGAWWTGSHVFDTINYDFGINGETYVATIDGVDHDVIRSLGWGFEKWKQRYIVKVGNSWYITPAQHNMIDDEWVNYHTGDWDAGMPTGPANSYDRRCAGCHTTGTNVEFYPETGEWVMGVSEENVQCEACHGPGETHAGSMNAADIINPSTDIADYDRELEVCGNCHGRGNSVMELGGSTMGYPFNAAGQNFRPGDNLDDFYVQNPGYWPSGHSKKHHQQFLDFKNLSVHYTLGSMTCVTCHNVHEPDADFTNDLCLNCHSGAIPDLNAHTKHATAKLCIDCHMPYTAKSAFAYDIRSHAFGIINPQVSMDNFLVDPANVIPNSCMNGGCHGGPAALADDALIQARIDAYNTLWP